MPSWLPSLRQPSSIIKKKEELQDPDNRAQLLETLEGCSEVGGWGIGLSIFAIGLASLRGNVNMVVLAFGMISYTTGPLLGDVPCTLHGKSTAREADPAASRPLLPFGTIYLMPTSGTYSSTAMLPAQSRLHLLHPLKQRAASLGSQRLMLCMGLACDCSFMTWGIAVSCSVV